MDFTVEQTLGALIEWLVTPSLPKGCCNHTNSKVAEVDVSKQMEAVAWIYTRYFCRMLATFQALHWNVLCEKAAALQPGLKKFMKADGDMRSLSLTEQRVKHVCEMATNQVDVDETFHTTSVCICLLNVRKDKCVVVLSNKTLRVWSFIEKNKQDMVSIEGIGQSDEAFALLAVKEQTGIGVNAIKVEESFIVQDCLNCLGGGNTRFYIMSCHGTYDLSPSILVERVAWVSISFALSSIDGPLLEKSTSGIRSSYCLQYFHVWPFCSVIKDWLTRQNQTLKTAGHDLSAQLEMSNERLLTVNEFQLFMLQKMSSMKDKDVSATDVECTLADVKSSTVVETDDPPNGSTKVDLLEYDHSSMPLEHRSTSIESNVVCKTNGTAKVELVKIKDASMPSEHTSAGATSVEKSCVDELTNLELMKDCDTSMLLEDTTGAMKIDIVCEMNALRKPDMGSTLMQAPMPRPLMAERTSSCGQPKNIVYETGELAQIAEGFQQVQSICPVRGGCQQVQYVCPESATKQASLNRVSTQLEQSTCLKDICDGYVSKKDHGPMNSHFGMSNDDENVDPFEQNSTQPSSARCNSLAEDVLNRPAEEDEEKQSSSYFQIHENDQCNGLTCSPKILVQVNKVDEHNIDKSKISNNNQGNRLTRSFKTLVQGSKLDEHNIDKSTALSIMMSAHRIVSKRRKVLTKELINIIANQQRSIDSLNKQIAECDSEMAILLGGSKGGLQLALKLCNNDAQNVVAVHRSADQPEDTNMPANCHTPSFDKKVTMMRKKKFYMLEGPTQVLPKSK